MTQTSDERPVIDAVIDGALTRMGLSQTGRDAALAALDLGEPQMIAADDAGSAGVLLARGERYLFWHWRDNDAPGVYAPVDRADALRVFSFRCLGHLVFYDEREELARDEYGALRGLVATG